MHSWWQIVPNLALNSCFNFPPPTPFCIKLDISSWIVMPTVTSQFTCVAAQPPMCGREPCTTLIMCTTPSSHSSQTYSFRVLRSLSIVWSTETMVPAASHVVILVVRDFNSPSSIVCGHSIFLATVGAMCSTLCCVLPLLLHLVRRGLSHGSRVINSQRQSSNAVVWPSVYCFFILDLSTRHACMTLFSSLLISTSSNKLFFLNHT